MSSQWPAVSAGGVSKITFRVMIPKLDLPLRAVRQSCPKPNLPSWLTSLTNDTNSYPVFQAGSNQDKVLWLLSPRCFCSKVRFSSSLVSILARGFPKFAIQSLSTIVCATMTASLKAPQGSKLSIGNRDGRPDFRKLSYVFNCHISNLDDTAY